MENKLYLGHHLNTQHGFLTTADYAEKIGANFFQIFLSSPKQYNTKRRPEEDLIGLNKKLVDKGMKMVIHANFMLNFCNPISSYKHKAAIKLLVNDLKDSVIVGAIGVVIHMGKQLKMDKDEAIANYVSGVSEVLKQTSNNSIVILETGAGQGTEVCTSIFELGKLYKRFTKSEQKRIKFCIDTCHIFAAGYNIGDRDYVDIFKDLVELHLSWNKVACIHLNDSKCEALSKKDRHADIGKGCIGLEGLKKFTQLCQNKAIPIVLETPCEDNFSKEEQIKMVKSWFY